MIRVFLADDHAILRAGIRRILADQVDMQLIGETDNGLDAVRQLRDAAADVMLLDLSLPGLSGMDVLKQVRAAHPQLRVLVLSMHAEDQYAVRVLKSGAAGYVTKESAADVLLRAIRKVAAGGTFVSEALADRLAEFVRQPESAGAPHEQLSDREFQIFLMLAAGRKVTEIARDLHLSVKSISTYRSRICEKMQFRNNAELVGYAVKSGLIYQAVPRGDAPAE